MRLKKVLVAALTVSSFSVGFTAKAHDHSATATYLGNEGVMVSRGETKILFDAFYANSYGQYSLVPDEISDAMLAGTPPYDGIDAIFVSHVHGDHFSAEPAIAYLRAHSDVKLFASVQVKDALIEAGVPEDDPIMGQLETFDLKPTDDPIAIALDGLAVDAVAIPHAGNRPTIQNFVWRITLDDQTTVMHMGDAGTIMSDFDRHADHFSEKTSDAAFPPYWFHLDEDGRAILEKHIRAGQTVGIHVPARASGSGDTWREQAGGDLFTDPGETRSLEEKSE